jgi:hypothetical protein
MGKTMHAKSRILEEKERKLCAHASDPDAFAMRWPRSPRQS